VTAHPTQGAGSTAGDAELLRGFEGCTLRPAAFGHREHVHVAWLLLGAHPLFEDAAHRFCRGLRAFAAAHGKSTLYHETITWAYLALVHERLRAAPPGEAFDAFVARNADLLAPGLAALSPLYDAALLRSPAAKQAFLLPRPAGARRAARSDRVAPLERDEQHDQHRERHPEEHGGR
jgi:hypothetical protein